MLNAALSSRMNGAQHIRSATMARRLRTVVERARADTAWDWREDLRLFALAWAAGFLFFLILIG